MYMEGVEGVGSNNRWCPPSQCRHDAVNIEIRSSACLTASACVPSRRSPRPPRPLDSLEFSGLGPTSHQPLVHVARVLTPCSAFRLFVPVLTWSSATKRGAAAAGGPPRGAPSAVTDGRDGRRDGLSDLANQCSVLQCLHFLLPLLLSIVLHCSYLTYLTFNYLSYLKKKFISHSFIVVKW